MHKLTICAACCIAIVLASCRGTPEENMIEVANGPFKALVRSQEFHHSGIHNIDICVGETSSHTFPEDEAQCFLHGFDFKGLSVKRLAEHELEISFVCGRVSHFTNDASVYPKGPVPVAFHATLRDGCGKIDDGGEGEGDTLESGGIHDR